jgi:hypothetical protein
MQQLLERLIQHRIQDRSLNRASHQGEDLTRLNRRSVITCFDSGRQLHLVPAECYL